MQPALIVHWVQSPARYRFENSVGSLRRQAVLAAARHRQHEALAVRDVGAEVLRVDARLARGRRARAPIDQQLPAERALSADLLAGVLPHDVDAVRQQIQHRLPHLVPLAGRGRARARRVAGGGRRIVAHRPAEIGDVPRRLPSRPSFPLRDLGQIAPDVEQALAIVLPQHRRDVLPRQRPAETGRRARSAQVCKRLRAHGLHALDHLPPARALRHERRADLVVRADGDPQHHHVEVAPAAPAPRCPASRKSAGGSSRSFQSRASSSPPTSCSKRGRCGQQGKVLDRDQRIVFGAWPGPRRSSLARDGDALDRAARPQPGLQLLDAVEELELHAAPFEHLVHRHVAAVAGAGGEAVGQRAAIGEQPADDPAQHRARLVLGRGRKRRAGRCRRIAVLVRERRVVHRSHDRRIHHEIAVGERVLRQPRAKVLIVDRIEPAVNQIVADHSDDAAVREIAEDPAATDLVVVDVRLHVRPQRRRKQAQRTHQQLADGVLAPAHDAGRNQVPDRERQLLQRRERPRGRHSVTARALGRPAGGSSCAPGAARPSGASAPSSARAPWRRRRRGAARESDRTAPRRTSARTPRAAGIPAPRPASRRSAAREPTIRSAGR